MPALISGNTARAKCNIFTMGNIPFPASCDCADTSRLLLVTAAGDPEQVACCRGCGAQGGGLRAFPPSREARRPPRADAGDQEGDLGGPRQHARAGRPHDRAPDAWKHVSRLGLGCRPWGNAEAPFRRHVCWPDSLCSRPRDHPTGGGDAKCVEQTLRRPQGPLRQRRVLGFLQAPSNCLVGAGAGGSEVRSALRRRISTSHLPGGTLHPLMCSCCR